MEKISSLLESSKKKRVNSDKFSEEPRMELDMKLNKYVFSLLLLVILTSCSIFESRDFSDQMDEYLMTDDPMFKPNQDFMIMAGDSGRHWRDSGEIRQRTPASVENKVDYLYSKSLERELRHLESRMSQDEYFEFERNREKIGSTSEQIYYLRLSERERAEYLGLKGVDQSNMRNSRGYYARGAKRVGFHEPYPITNSTKTGVTLGMNMEDVTQSWGAPEKRDIAGNPILKNERWAFRKNGKIKYIYFEDGKVQGWSEQ